MRKVFILVLIFVAIGAAGWFVVRAKKSEKHTAVPTVTPTVSYKKACDVFTLKDAVSLLGDGTAHAPSSSDHISANKSVTTCVYNYDPGSYSDLISASLFLQGSSAAEANQSFTGSEPGNSIKVDGYGDGAYWNPNLGQLNILKGQYLLIISAGSGPLDQREKDLPRKIADTVIKRL